jgi:DNA-binding CsgD family transcriptional regulator
VERLVGREAELNAVHDALAMPLPHGILLEGEAGIGKTALWDAGIAEAASRGMRVLVARPAEAETALSHAALGDILAPVVDQLPPDFPAPQRRALDVALLRTAAEPGPLDPRAVGAATLGALRPAAASAPLLIGVDDIQWLDLASAAALRFALRRLGDDDAVLLFATRRTERGSEPVEVGLAEQRLTRIVVGPLEADALRLMLRSRLGESVERPALARLAEVAGGNPYFALELGRAALRQGGGPAARGTVALPEAISAVLNDRLGALPRETRDALGTVAAMGHPTVSTVAEWLDPRLLDPAFASGVLCEEGESIRFDHPLLAEAAYRMLTPSSRRSVHERLAELAVDVEERARHLAAGSPTPEAGVAAQIEKGAEAAAGRGARSAAAELLEASARVEPDADRATLRRIAAVRHHIAGGDGRRAIALSNTLVQELPPGPLRARALIVRAAQEGRFDQLFEFARQAAAEAGDDRELLIEALDMQGVLLMLLDRPEEAGIALQQAQELCTPDVPRTLRIQVLSDYGDLAHHRGDPGAIALQREAAALEGDDLIPSANWSPTTLLGRSLMLNDELQEARPLLEERHRRALEAGDDEATASLSIMLAELELRAGSIERALRLADEGLALQKGSWGEAAQGASAYGRALVAAYQGDAGLANELAESGLAQCQAQADGIFEAANRSTLGFLEFSLGDDAAAVDRFSFLIERFRSGTAGDPGLRQNVHLPEAIEALIALGRLEEAEELLGVWEELGERFDRPRIRATAARCRALLGAAHGDLDAALVHAEVALEHHRDLPVPFERARTLIVLGTLHRRTKRKAAARAALEEAIEILDSMGARLWAGRARAELGRIGGRARSDGLTPTEQRVADLVAEGRSNKEVAEALFVSVRTVEANLTRVYAKLGIRSRTELAASRATSGGPSRSPAPPPASRS